MTLVDIIWLLYGEHVKYLVETVLSYLEVLAWPLLVLGLVYVFRKPARDILTAFQERVKFMTGASIGNTNFTFASPSAEDLGDSNPMPVSTSFSFAPPSGQDSLSTKAGMVQKFLSIAHDASERGNNQEAISNYRKVNILVPNQIQVIHNLAVELIRLGRETKVTEYLIEAETLCKNALPLSDTFPYGTFYNLARAQAAANNIQGLRETLGYMSRIRLPDNLALALAKEDPHIKMSDEIGNLPEYKKVVEIMRQRFDM